MEGRLYGTFLDYQDFFGSPILRPANSHGSAVSLTIFCHFSRSHDKSPNLTGFLEKSCSNEINLTFKRQIY